MLVLFTFVLFGEIQAFEGKKQFTPCVPGIQESLGVGGHNHKVNWDFGTLESESGAAMDKI